MASNCRVELPSPPQRRRARPKAKVSTSNSQHDGSPNGEGSLASRPSWQRSHLSVSLTQETSKLRKDLSKIIVLDVISGQTTDDILLEFLLGALNTPPGWMQFMNSEVILFWPHLIVKKKHLRQAKLET